MTESKNDILTAEEQKAKLKKEAEQKKLQPTKQYYDVKIECTLPATLTWRVLAETPQQALALTKGVSPNQVRHRLVGRRDLKATIYDAGSTFIKWIQNLHV